MLAADVTGGRDGSPAAASSPSPSPRLAARSPSPTTRSGTGTGAAPAPRPECGHGPAGEPLAGTDLLERLRMSGRPRLPADPGLCESVARRLDDGLAGSTHTPGRTAPIRPEDDDHGTPIVGGSAPQGRAGRPVVVTKASLTRALTCDEHASGAVLSRRPPSRAMACGAIVDAVFRQLITVGSIEDATADGLAALRVDGRHDELLAWVAELPPAEWSALVTDVEKHADGLRRRWPRLVPAWMPRTQDPMRVIAGAGRVELAARVDLALGLPGRDVASVALVELKSGAPRPEHRDDLRFAALVETLRHGVPPFAVASYYTRTGMLDVEPVTPATLERAVERTILGGRRLLDEVALDGTGRGEAPPDLCATCQLLAAQNSPVHAERADTGRSATRRPRPTTGVTTGPRPW